jgi:hypothetical protein
MNIKLIDLGTIVFKFEEYGKKGLTHDYSLLFKIAELITDKNIRKILELFII